MKRAVWGWGEEVVGAIVRWGSGGIVRSVVDNCFFPPFSLWNTSFALSYFS